jgi:acyl-CoA synthetase (AMP-forming)/AMP-acid ligase II
MRKWKIHEPQGWKANRPMVTLCFLGFDHIGGLNTIFHTLFNGGTIVIPSDRSVKTAVEAIERHKVQLLPTSPTFLRMMLANCESDIPSLELITYGTEPMPESTLNLVRERWPRIRCKQTYGMTELGILGTKSKDDGSLWMKVKETYRIADGKLEVKHDGSLVGYLNATCPITEDGYYQTGDCVESDGEYIRIIGRASEFINVGGEKVHPVEIENDLLKLDEIEDCLVQSESNLIMGEIIKATIKPAIEIDHKEMAKLVKGFLSSIAYPRWKIPQRIEIRNEPLHNSRHKKVRTCSNSKNLEEQTSN